MSPSADALPVTLDEVIAFVGRLHPDADSLMQLQDAVVVGERLEVLGDDVVGHFVHQARSDGATWNAIGESMGVSKQAAQKRFVVAVGDRDDGLLSRFTPRARHVLSAARVDAQRGGATEVETVHLVLALVEDPDSLAARALLDMGASAEQVRAAAEEVVAAKQARPPKSQVRFAPESRAVLQGAVEEALQLGHNYVGTEHLLLAVVAQPDTDGARVLAGLGVTRRKCLSRVKGMLAKIVAERAGG